MRAAANIIGLLLIAIGGLGIFLAFVYLWTVDGWTAVALMVSPATAIATGVLFCLLSQMADALERLAGKSVVREKAAAPLRPPSWLVVGVDSRGNSKQAIVRGDDREAAFAEAVNAGIVRANRIELA